jgi:hypothetical protein
VDVQDVINSHPLSRFQVSVDLQTGRADRRPGRLNRAVQPEMVPSE